MLIVDGIEYAAPVVANYFPGRVAAPDGVTHDACRAIVTEHRCYVYKERLEESGVRRAYTAFTIDVAHMRPSGAAWVLTDPAGVEWTVGTGAGCGCALASLRSMPSPIPAWL